MLPKDSCEGVSFSSGKFNENEVWAVENDNTLLIGLAMEARRDLKLGFEKGEENRIGDGAGFG